MIRRPHAGFLRALTLGRPACIMGAWESFGYRGTTLRMGHTPRGRTAGTVAVILLAMAPGARASSQRPPTLLSPVPGESAHPIPSPGTGEGTHPIPYPGTGEGTHPIPSPGTGEGRVGVPRPATAVFDVTGLTWDELCTAEALQGLANRRGPRIYLDHGEKADRRWLDIYAERAGLRYERVPTLPDLLRRFRSAAKGLVVYDPTVDGSRYVAVTITGVEGLLPVSPDVLEGTSPAMRSGGAQPLSSM
ncbi:MAG: hypothetical protein FJX72_22065, partial [Armatimonadetes bacterium]|nr:hypothetical protein [Armatimonadota bacterium]